LVNPTDVESAEQLARTTRCQLLTNGTRTGVQTTGRPNTIPDSGRITVTIADLYFPAEPRPIIVFVDGQVHLKTSQMVKDEELRALLRKRGYRVLELSYSGYSDKKRDELYEEILNGLGRSLAARWSIHNSVNRS